MASPFPISMAKIAAQDQPHPRGALEENNLAFSPTLCYPSPSGGGEWPENGGNTTTTTTTTTTTATATATATATSEVYNTPPLHLIHTVDLKPPHPRPVTKHNQATDTTSTNR